MDEVHEVSHNVEDIEADQAERIVLAAYEKLSEDKRLERLARIKQMLLPVEEWAERHPELVTSRPVSMLRRVQIDQITRQSGNGKAIEDCEQKPPAIARHRAGTSKQDTI